MKGHAVEDEKESEKKSSVKAAKVLINLNGTIIVSLVHQLYVVKSV